jgi:hypothetical protein
MPVAVCTQVFNAVRSSLITSALVDATPMTA